MLSTLLKEIFNQKKLTVKQSQSLKRWIKNYPYLFMINPDTLLKSPALSILKT